MTLDPQVKAFLDNLAAHRVPPMHKLSPEENRRALKRIVAKNHKLLMPEVNIKEQLIPVKDGEIKIRIYSPNGEGPFPILVFFHGGGYIMGDLEMLDHELAIITNSAGCLVISVDYRLAPEFKFPTAMEDCYFATKWVAENTKELNGDPHRIAIGGDSAGGNLAAAVSLLARQNGGPDLCFQVLLYPCVDALNDYPSYHQFSKGYFITPEDIHYFKYHYLRTAEDKHNIYVSPILAEDFSNLPAALVITAGYDPLRDQGKAYAERLMEAGIKVEYCCYEGMIHGFFGMSRVFDQGKNLIERIVKTLERVFV